MESTIPFFGSKLKLNEIDLIIQKKQEEDLTRREILSINRKKNIWNEHNFNNTPVRKTFFRILSSYESLSIFFNLLRQIMNISIAPWFRYIVCSSREQSRSQESRSPNPHRKEYRENATTSDEIITLSFIHNYETESQAILICRHESLFVYRPYRPPSSVHEFLNTFIILARAGVVLQAINCKC